MRQAWTRVGSQLSLSRWRTWWQKQTNGERAGVGRLQVAAHSGVLLGARPRGTSGPPSAGWALRKFCSPNVCRRLHEHKSLMYVYEARSSPTTLRLAYTARSLQMFTSIRVDCIIHLQYSINHTNFAADRMCTNHINSGFALTPFEPRSFQPTGQSQTRNKKNETKQIPRRLKPILQWQCHRAPGLQAEPRGQGRQKLDNQ